ncbi:ABC transporter permease [Streptomyces sp. TRM72054]|uniref:ABC transporter permease n=1 Tax=Streptomyces sp. TRM72054 TaxID=2870562 RepID=UPI0021AB81FF|nr:ABC transporter permease [Streptomyces sp. TRM72054]
MRALDRTTWTLTWRLTRAGGRTGLLATGLAVAAAAVSTTLLLLCVAMNLGFQHRADRTDWRTPVKSSHPVAIEAVGTTFTRGEAVTVVDVAQLPGRTAPAPPGLDRLPAPGELWVSPALGALLDRLPADRHPVPGTPAGTLGRAALAHPGELVAVIGHRPGDPAVTAERAPDPRRVGDIATPTRVASFTGRPLTDGTGMTYELLARVATVLVIVPLLVLAASAARLSVSRRDQRLAALRLIGATPGRIAGLTAAEALLTGTAGALLGAVGYAVLLPVAASLPLAGGSWYAADLWIGALPLLAVTAGVIALVVISALAGLRQVVVGPLGVARRSRSRGASAVRAVLFVAAVAVYGWVTREYGSADVVALYAFAAVFLALTVIGPWVVRMLGRIVTALAKRPATLLAGRRLLDDPKAAWRIVSGLTLAGFVAGFFALLTLNTAPPWGGRPDQLAIAAPPGKVAQLRTQAEQRLHAGRSERRGRRGRRLRGHGALRREPPDHRHSLRRHSRAGPRPHRADRPDTRPVPAHHHRRELVRGTLHPGLHHHHPGRARGDLHRRHHLRRDHRRRQRPGPPPHLRPAAPGWDSPARPGRRPQPGDPDPGHRAGGRGRRDRALVRGLDDAGRRRLVVRHPRPDRSRRVLRRRGRRNPGGRRTEPPPAADRHPAGGGTGRVSAVPTTTAETIPPTLYANSIRTRTQPRRPSADQRRESEGQQPELPVPRLRWRGRPGGAVHGLVVARAFLTVGDPKETA